MLAKEVFLLSGDMKLVLLVVLLFMAPKIDPPAGGVCIVEVTGGNVANYAVPGHNFQTPD